MKNYVKYFSILLALFFAISSCTKKTTPAPSESSSYGLTTTFAGSLSYGYVNGKDTTARFSGPSSVDVDQAGNIYVADAGNQDIRKITPSGIVTTIAGSGQMGAANGLGTAASFTYPYGIAVDINGNIYVADAGNNLIRKITPDGMVSTLAGSGAKGSQDGPGTSATFNFPYGIAVDVAGNVYVADASNNTVRKITVAGIVSTLAGDGTVGAKNGNGVSASFNYPQDLDIDGSGNIYVADEANHLIRKITPSGVVTTFAGTGIKGSDDGPVTTATFNYPDSITHDADGNIYVSDEGSSLIRKITPAGMVSTLAGNGSFGFANGIGKAAVFNEIFGIAIDKSNNLFVADLGNYMIRKVIAK